MGVALGPVLDPIMEIDILVGVMNLLTLVHATRSTTRGVGSGSGLGVCLFATVLAFGVEFASVWFGVTHCRGDQGDCVGSSFNSVLYYVPWIYTSLVSGQRLGVSARATPFVVGALMHGFIGTYEYQGPTMGWWKWPHSGNRVIAQLEPFLGFDVVSVIDGEFVLQTHPHALQAILTQFNGVPVMAGLFHVALGVGIASAFSLTGPLHLWGPVSAVRYGAALLLTVPIALLFDLPTTLGEMAGVSRSFTAPMMGVMAAVLPILLWPAEAAVSTPPSARQPDWLLFLIPVLNHGYFSTYSLRHGIDIPADLAVYVHSIAVLSLAAHRRACCLVPPRALTRAKTE